jgi:Tfp pilus assembly protein PilF
MITSVLVFFTVLMLSNWNIWVAALAMLFFGLNPMHVEAVAWITARKDQMMALMVFGTIVLYLGYVKTIVSVTGMRKFVLGLIFHTLLILGFLLAIFSKGMAVVLPVALVVMDRFLNRTWQWTEKLSMPSTAKFLLGSITEKAVLFGIMVYLGMQVTQEQNAGGIHVSLLNIDILRGSYGLTVQTLKYFFPYHGFMCAHIHNEYSKPLAMTCTVLVAVWIWSLWYFRKYPVYVFGMLFYFVFVGVIHYVPGGNNIMMAERYILIGSVGLSFPLCWYMGQWVKGNTSRQWIVGGVACIYFAFFIYNTTVRVLVWRSSVTLWEDVIEKRPTNATAYSRVATAYYEELDDPKTAIQNLEIGLKHTPKHLRMLTSYIVYLSRGNGNTDSIIQKSNTAIPIAEMRHDSVRIALLYYSRGTAYARKESDEQAIADLSHCLSFQTYDFMSDVYTNLGILHGEKGSIVLASSMFKKALLTDPAFSQTYKMWSLMFYKNNMIDSALAKCNMYLQHSKNAKDSSDALLMRENMFRK